MEKQLAAIKKALEMGATIEVKFFGKETQDEARIAAQTIGEMVGEEIEHVEGPEDRAESNWYRTKNFLPALDIVSYYQKNT